LASSAWTFRAVPAHLSVEVRTNVIEVYRDGRREWNSLARPFYRPVYTN
jgi:hypothetical protein